MAEYSLLLGIVQKLGEIMVPMKNLFLQTPGLPNILFQNIGVHQI